LRASFGANDRRSATMLKAWARAAAAAAAAIAIAPGMAGAQAPGGGQPPAVTVVTLQPQDVTLTATLPGRVVASGAAEVRPQVNGVIVERLFDEGADVAVGDPLYRIDEATYRAAVTSAEAQVAQAEARLRAAAREEERVKTLIARAVASEQSYDEALAAREAAEALVAVAEANLDAARIDLDRTMVRAQLSGVIGRSLTTQGVLVTASQPEPMAVIRTLDPVLVDVTQSAAEVLAWRQGQAAAQAEGVAQTVTLTLADGSTYAETGSLTAAEPYVNELTGVVTLRLTFPNPDRLLLPGMYVQVEMPQALVRDAILAPMEGVSRDRRGRPTALVINAENVVEARELTVLQAQDADWVVTSGLSAGDRLIVAGLQKARPGAPVAPQERGADAAAD
jgi:membrane fusion protein (multidrug efflux system)